MIISIGEYPDNWKEIAKETKEDAGWRCVRCGHPHESPKERIQCNLQCDLSKHIETQKMYYKIDSSSPRERNKAYSFFNLDYWPHQRQRVLTVHHLDNNKSNCEWWNLTALCQVCHLQIQAKVIMERPFMFDHSHWFRPYVAGYYANELGQDTSKGYVYMNIEALLERGKEQVLV